ncbi:MAG: DUF368 domain-containing protein [Deltaproteobacteria bacterium]|nr:MAG: DUF368 domain-containing protein [Deltaproteobacteria bacterium]
MKASGYIITFVKGILVGVANIIPGVSGGTFALILGIYERLIGALGSAGTRSLAVLARWLVKPGDRERRRELLAELARLDFWWLLVLAAGAAAAILASSRVIVFLLDHYRSATLAFFVGLIVPSVLVPYGMMERRGWPQALACLAGCTLLVVFTALVPPATGGTDNPLMLFFSGALAISAMILPGVSGSFVLMVLGQYRAVLEAINHWNLLPLGIFAAGCLVGLLAFVRMLKYLLEHYHATTLAFLIGLILGSLWVLWPFKEVAAGAKLVEGRNIWPTGFDREVLYALLAGLAGMACSAGLNRLGRSETGGAGEARG